MYDMIGRLRHHSRFYIVAGADADAAAHAAVDHHWTIEGSIIRPGPIQGTWRTCTYGGGTVQRRRTWIRSSSQAPADASASSSGAGHPGRRGHREPDAGEVDGSAGEWPSVWSRPWQRLRGVSCRAPAPTASTSSSAEGFALAGLAEQRLAVATPPASARSRDQSAWLKRDHPVEALDRAYELPADGLLPPRSWCTTCSATDRRCRRCEQERCCSPGRGWRRPPRSSCT